MRFAIKTSPQNTTWADMLAVWQAADEIELFESAWTFDHFYPIFTDDVERRLHGGLDHRSPPSPRRPAACGSGCSSTGDAVPPSGGARQDGRHRSTSSRAAGSSSGIGAGWNEVEAKCVRHRPARRPHRALRRVRRGVRGDHRPADQRTARPSTGRYVQLTDAYCNPKPIQQPHPPICIGGQGERRTLRSVARFAQHWNFPGGTAEQFAAKLDVLRAALRRRSGATRRRSRCRRT